MPSLVATGERQIVITEAMLRSPLEAVSELKRFEIPRIEPLDIRPSMRPHRFPSVSLLFRTAHRHGDNARNGVRSDGRIAKL